MLSMVKNLKAKRKNKKGFTLVELVIVIAILAIIAAIAIPMVTNTINNANDSADKSNAQAIELACKTAWSEIEAGGTVDSVTDDKTITVANALKEQKITKDGKLPKIKLSTNVFGYEKGGKILTSGGTALDKDGKDKLSDIM